MTFPIYGKMKAMFETTNQITFIHVAHHAACDAQVMRRSYLVIYHADHGPMVGEAPYVCWIRR
jgi:hypothetical protein